MPSQPTDQNTASAPSNRQPVKAPIGELLRVHFVAVGGTGMGSLAGLLKRRGIDVTGSDKALYPPMSDALATWGISLSEGFDPKNLEAEAYGSGRRPDLIVIGNAVRPDNPEAKAAIASGIPYRSFSDALFELAMAQKHRIVVSGTHGKTTTTSITAYLLLATGRDPSLLVGGISLDFDGSFREGDGAHFVVEGDEYDTAFFDKTPKFLHYEPASLILTSVEFDHADIYRDLDHVKSAFRDLVHGMPREACIVADWAHEHVRDVTSEAICQVLRYQVIEHGDAPEGIDVDFVADQLQAREDGTHFRLRKRGEQARHVVTPLFGGFNVANSTAALAVLDEQGVPLAESIEALAGFRGVKRRQEIRGEVRGVTVIDDFAHHPTAVNGSIGAIRARFPGRRLVAIFEARTNTSRRAIFQDAYAGAFGEADRVVLRKLPEEPIYSNTGEPTELFSAEDLASALVAQGTEAEVFEDIDAAAREQAAKLEAGDVVLVMSNGDFGNIWQKILDGLEAG
ncbi:MAG: UDP-N-acetylmuramate: L-alanyl-gamma-D-glutamyl-meso-diaminopimelate ligase [Myxococcota bacterium]|jgi:UDP-N-acetylmuramate: L-alanyl-gamma-D-glutamyl-meso-diaminopimelate ligase